MGERVVRRTIAGLSAVPALAAQEVDRLTEEIGGRAAQVTGPLRSAGKATRLSELADEVDALAAEMVSAVGAISSEVAAVVSKETAELERLLSSSAHAPAGGQQTNDRPAGEDPAVPSEVAGVIARLMADRRHPLDLTRALADPARREQILTILAELADGQTLAGRSLEEYRHGSPGRGPLFGPVPPDINVTDTGESRKDAYVTHCKAVDAVRRVGADPGEAEIELIDDYGRRLRDDVAPQVRAEVEAVGQAFGRAEVSLRVKQVDGLVEKVRRMSEGSTERPGRPDYQVGDVIDAVGARITVDDTSRLVDLVTEVKSRLGTGDSGRILEMQNMYESPKPHNRAYRTVTFLVVIDVEDLPYAYELQLCTQRASVASDLEHNTVYKPYVAVSQEEQDLVRRMQAEAAASDQEETRRAFP